MSAPNIEAAVITYLKTATATSRIDHRTPTTKTTPWVKVAELDAKGDYPDHLIDFLVQCDCYAGSSSNTRTGAKQLADAVRDALADMAGGTHSGAVVSGVDLSGRPLPDESFEPAMERYIVEARVWAHA